MGTNDQYVMFIWLVSILTPEHIHNTLVEIYKHVFI